MNPYQPPAIERPTQTTLLPSLVTIALVIVSSIVIATSSNWFGAHGFGISLYAVAGCWYVLASCSKAMFSQIHRTRPTRFEFVVVLAICSIFYGLALPAVATNCEGRRRSVVLQSSGLREVQTNDFEVNRPYSER